ncbi:MAG: hypothetical protein XXXJIFNMEKO3_01623 [Candidatus Erwinia impunctatus]|nr:hypothetical protein XXXJIFNMEKO_01623 [Culicoides impunctatus]
MTISTTGIAYLISYSYKHHIDNLIGFAACGIPTDQQTPALVTVSLCSLRDQLYYLSGIALIIPSGE